MRKLTRLEKAAANAIMEGKGMSAAARSSGMSRETLYRRLKDPAFMAYLELKGEEAIKVITARTEKERLEEVRDSIWDLDRAVARAELGKFYLEIARSEKNPVVRMQAMKEAERVAREYKVPGESLGNGDTDSNKLDVYEPLWMQ